jgi:hypothetical protein
MQRWRAATAVAFLLAGATATVGSAAPVGNGPRVVVESATWQAASAVFSGSSCSQISQTTVSCSHNYNSVDANVGETCSVGATSLQVDPLACHATFSGVSSGFGVIVNESHWAPLCHTVGIQSGSFQISGTTGSYPPIPVTIHVSHGAGVFAGSLNLLSGTTLLEETVAGHFTNGCGAPPITVRGAGPTFGGTWQVVVVA